MNFIVNFHLDQADSVLIHIVIEWVKPPQRLKTGDVPAMDQGSSLVLDEGTSLCQQPERGWVSQLHRCKTSGLPLNDRFHTHVSSTTKIVRSSKTCRVDIDGDQTLQRSMPVPKTILGKAGGFSRNCIRDGIVPLGCLSD